MLENPTNNTNCPQQILADFLDTLNSDVLNAPSLVIAVSGGGDSMSLLHAANTLWSIRKNLPKLIAVSINHGLRDAALAEIEQVENYCVKAEIQHVTRNWTGKKPTSRIQEFARNARYKLLADVATEHNAGAILTAHNLEDQLETISMRRDHLPKDIPLLRPTLGMANATLINAQHWVLRPFLNTQKTHLRDYLSNNNIEWCEDSSNDDTQYERVRTRHQLQRAGYSQSETNTSNEEGLRFSQSQNIALLIQRHCKFHSNYLVTIPLNDDFLKEPNAYFTIAYVGCVLGGKKHLQLTALFENLRTLVAEKKTTRFSLNRCIFEFRKDILYVYRENRNIPNSSVMPNECIIWDGRFKICNNTTHKMYVSTNHSQNQNLHLHNGFVFSDSATPTRVNHEINKATPKIHFKKQIDRQKTSNYEVKPCLAIFELFLPIFDLAVAQSIAKALFLKKFPTAPFKS